MFYLKIIRIFATDKMSNIITKEILIEKITAKYNKIGDVAIDMDIKNSEGSEKCKALVTDDNEICLVNEKGDWVYPITELTKRELENVYKQINLQNRLKFIA